MAGVELEAVSVRLKNAAEAWSDYLRPFSAYFLHKAWLLKNCWERLERSLRMLRSTNGWLKEEVERYP